MDFYSITESLGMKDVHLDPESPFPLFEREETVIGALLDILLNNRRVYYYGDYDPDGGYALEILKETSKAMKFDNYKTFKYLTKTHDVDYSFVQEAISSDVDYVIICDAGSSDPQVMARFMQYGIKVILIDHHQSPYDYEDFPDIYMCNSSFDNRRRDSDIQLSAAALTYILCVKALQQRGVPEPQTLAPLALASMYADVIDMSSPIARSIYFKAMKVPKMLLPSLIQRAMDDYSVFRRRFIEFRLNPMINGLFRSNSSKLLNSLLDWTPNSEISVPELIESIDSTNTYFRDQYRKASDILEYEVLDHFVLGNLSSVVGEVGISADLLPNYTGLVANTLCEKFNKTALVFADTGSEVKASLRDLHGRNYLDLFKRFCDARGHNSAFGIHIKYLEFREWMDYIRMVDDKFSINSVGNDPIVIRHNYEIPHLELVEYMAIYNEFSGVGVPRAYLSKTWFSDQNPYKNPKAKYYSYNWGAFKIISPSVLRLGTEVLLQPIMAGFSSKRKVELRVVTRF